MMSLYEKCQKAGDKQIHDNYVYIGQSSNGIVEIPLTGRQIKSICTTGDNDIAVDAICSDAKVKECLAKYSVEQIRNVLKEYGNWDDEELHDQKANISRLLWTLAWDICTGGQEHCVITRCSSTSEAAEPSA